MAVKMTKCGSSDNEITYEFMCDTLADLAKIENRYVTMGSVAVIIDGFEVYIANSQHEWVGLNTTSTQEGE